MKTDFSNEENFVDDFCYSTCYLYPICPNCAGANYLVNNTFKTRSKSKCRIQKLVSLFIADLQSKQIVKNPESLDEETLYHSIEAIKNIRKNYLEEFPQLL